MCGQWSKNGYMHNNKASLKNEMKLNDWKKIVDELAENNIKSLLIRGGEPFLFPDIIELLRYINKKGIFISIDNNGTQIKKFAEELVEIGNIHLTISVDGTPEIHDNVRGIKGCFDNIKQGVEEIIKFEKKYDRKIGKSINFTISPYSYKDLGKMPDLARNLSIDTVCIVPYYYIPEKYGLEYEKTLMDKFKSPAFSWRGFHHESSGVDIEEFKLQYNEYKSNLKDIYNYPYMDLNINQYIKWFKYPLKTVKTKKCFNVYNLIDIQPNGTVNFCVDYCDFSFGNIKESNIYELWNSKKAKMFRSYRKKHQLPVCYRCGAKYMGLIKN